MNQRAGRAGTAILPRIRAFSHFSLRDFLGAAGLIIVLVALALFAAWWSVDPALPKTVSLATGQEKSAWRLDEIEARVNQMSIPLAFADSLYRLRNHINFVRQRVRAAAVDVTTPPMPSTPTNSRPSPRRRPGPMLSRE